MTKISVPKPRTTRRLARVKLPDHVDILARWATAPSLICASARSPRWRRRVSLDFGTEGTLRVESDAKRLTGGRRGDKELREIPIPSRPPGCAWTNSSSTGDAAPRNRDLAQLLSPRRPPVRRLASTRPAACPRCRRSRLHSAAPARDRAEAQLERRRRCPSREDIDVVGKLHLLPDAGVVPCAGNRSSSSR